MLKTVFKSIVIILFICATSAQAVKKKCHTCSKDITRTFISVEGKYFHPSHFICATCKKTIESKGYFYENDKFYDAECYKKLHFFPCYHCNKNITGIYVEYENNTYHNDCYNNNIAIKCDLCSENLAGEYLIDLYGNNFCQSHKGVDHQCEFCQSFFGAPTNDGGFEYNDGRKICTTCNDKAIDSKSKLNDLTVEVNQLLAKFELEIPIDKISLKLVDREFLYRESSDTNSNLLGYTFFQEESSFFGFGKKTILTVYILEGMPRMWTIEALAHELNHVWQFLRSSEDKETAFCEGSANYAAYLVLQKYDDKFADILVDNLFKNKDPYYGEGFRRVRKLVDENSLLFWRNYLSDRKTFPDGF
jgi:hypothetical protein